MAEREAKIDLMATREALTIRRQCSDYDIAERAARELVQRGFAVIRINGAPFEPQQR